MQRKKVLIIGGGFGGVNAGVELCRHSCFDMEIALINNNPYHYFQPNLYKIFSGFDGAIHEKREIFEKELKRFAIPFEKIFKNSKNFKLIADKANEIDLRQGIIKTESGRILDYDYLVLALGSETDFFGNLGIKKFSLEFKTPDDALNIRNNLDELFSRKEKRWMVKIIIIGGGVSGVELAASLAETAPDIAKIHGHPQKNFSVKIIEACQEILRQVSSPVRKIAMERLSNLNIEIFTNTCCANVEPGRFFDKNGKIFEYDLLIWTAGVRGNSLINQIKYILIEKKNTIKVDDYLRVIPFQNVFAVGDIAYSEMPMTAQSAIYQGAYVGYAIKRLIHGRKIFKYHPRKTGLIVPLGKNYGLLEFGWLKLSGRIVSYIRSIIHLRYLMGILPFKEALKIWRKWR